MKVLSSIDENSDAVDKEYVDTKLAKSGGAMTGAITRDLGSGTIADTNLFTVTGSTDGFKVNYNSTTADTGVTTLSTTDDANAKISIGNTISGTYKEAISVVNGSATVTGSVSGNAGTATKLQTARTIGIGTGATGTATSFDGSANITIPITDVKDAYVTWGGRGLSNNITPDDMGCIDEFGHNKLAFLPASCLEIKYSTDSGSTWTEHSLTDTQKIAMMTTIGPNVYIGGPNVTPTAENIANLRLRVRLACGPTTGGKLYTAAKKLLINYSTQGSGGNKVAIRYRTIANYKSDTDTWTTVGTYDVNGGSGWNSIPFAYTFGGSFDSQTSQIGQFEFVFYCTSLGTWGVKKPCVIDFRLIGATNWTMPSELARAGHLYTMDTSQNATFPQNVAASSFSTTGNITASSGDILLTKNANDSGQQVKWSLGSNDYARVYGGATASNAGYLEIATADDSNEPIYARQYSGNFATLTRTATLLDASGNTSFPGALTATSVNGYTLAAACAKGVVTTVDTSANLPTSNAVKTFVEGKGYTTNTGTVTSITVKGTSPISVDSESAITTSGTRTISHANSGVTAGTYRSVTVNATGHVTAGTNPTTLSGYGITDAKIASGVITLGSNTITPLTASSTLDATKLSGTIPSGCYTDTKNTAGSTDSSSKLFLVGATSQAANPQTYSQDTVYAGTDGHLYSNSKQAVNLSDSQNLTNKTYEGYTLGEACSKGVIEDLSSSASSDLVTGIAVVDYLQSNGYGPTNVYVGSTTPSSSDIVLWMDPTKMLNAQNGLTVGNAIYLEGTKLFWYE